MPLSSKSLSLAACALATAAFGENLLKNPDFESYSGKPGEMNDWNVSPGWTKGDIPSFRGMPFKMIYLEREGSGLVEQQDISVSSGKWYVIESWYKADLTPSPAGNFLLQACRSTEKDGKMNQQQLHAGLKFGSIADWVKVRTLFNSGDRQKLNFLARTIGEGHAAAGSPEFRELNDQDLDGPILLDPDFEKGIPEKMPLELFGGERLRISAKEYFKGKQSAVLSLNERTGVNLSANIPVKPGDEAVFSFMAKTDCPGVVAIPMIERQMDSSDKLFLRGQGEKKLSDQWAEARCDIRIPQESDRGKKSVKFLDGIQLLRCAVIFLKPDKDAKVWIDDLKIEIKHEKEDEPQPIFGSEKNPLKNSSFETGTDGWEPRFYQGMMDTNWPLLYGRAQSDGTTAVEGRRSLKIIVPEKTNGPSGASITSMWLPAKENQPYTVSFWAKAEKPGKLKHYLVEYGGRRTSCEVAVETEWKRYSATVTPKTTNRGFVFLLMEFEPGAYWLDAVQVEKGEIMTEYSPPGNLEVGAESERIYPWYLTGEKAAANVSLCSRFADARTMTLAWQIKDWRQKIVDSGQKNVAIRGKDTLVEPLALFSGNYGAFVADLTLKDPQSGLAAKSAMVYGIFPKVRKMDAEKSSFGVHHQCVSRNNLWLKGGDLGDMLDLFEMAGINWFADYSLLDWNNVQPEETCWVWPDNFIKAITGRKIKILPMLGCLMTKRHIPAWAIGEEEGVQPALRDNPQIWQKLPKTTAWKNFVKTVVEHYGKSIDAYEAFGEGGLLTPEGFIKLYSATREVLNEIKDPPRLVGPGLPGQALPYGPHDDTSVGRIFKLGLCRYLDVISAHYYPYPNYGSGLELESITDRYGNREESMRNSIKHVFDTYGKKPLWDTEYGFLGRSQLREWEKPDNFLNVRGMSPAQQARRFVRWRIIGMAAGFKRFFYHGFGDIVRTARGSNFHDMTEHTMAPKPITVAHAQLARRLDDFTFIKKVEITPTIWAYVFKADNKAAGIYWDYNAKKEGRLSLPEQADNDLLFEDLMGNAFSPEKNKPGYFTVPVDENPRYIITSDTDKLIALLEKAAPRDTAPVQIELGLTDGPTLAIGVKNIVKTPVAGAIKINSLPQGWQAAEETVAFADAVPDKIKIVSTPLRKFDNTTGMFNATCSADGNSVEASRKLCLAEVFRKGNVVVDGNISEQEYGAAPAIRIMDKAQNLPVIHEKAGGDPTSTWEGPADLSGDIYISWRPDALFIGLKIKDDTILNDASVDQLWSRDAIEIYLDTAPTQNMLCGNRYAVHQGRLSLAPGIEDGKPRFRFERTPGGEMRDIAQGKVETAYRKTPDGYNIEVKLPMKDITLKSGGVWGFYVNLYDVDRKENKKVVAMVWENVGRQYYETPSLWGYLVFE